MQVNVDGVPARWTRFYWPTALVISVAYFLIAQGSLKTTALLTGVILLGVPELYCAIRRRWVDTFSVWVWDRLGETRTTKISQWNAAHFLTCGAYLVIAGDVDKYTFTLGYLQFAASVVMSLWLLWHFFFFWWR